MNYNDVLKKVEEYKKEFEVLEIGQTLFKRKIFAVERNLNKNFATAIFVCSIHARENITSDLICKMIDDGLFDGVKEFNLAFIIMANPDGVELCFSGLQSAPEGERKRLFEINNKSASFSLWKANGRGVDLNNNFDADFKRIVNSESFSSSGFAGEFKESEEETKAVVNYLKKKNPFIVLCYHSKGEEIYYNYFQDEACLKRDKLIAERFSKSTGYQIKNPEKSSSGGLKDYVVQKLKIPALTIEVGSDELSHPIKKESLEDIYKRHKSIANDLEFAYNVFREF
ncbi:MAG: hypothetical protein IJA23_01525 [Clostridia bacterium]|nr:hypothetical protein [Clostridia bacterium]